MLVVVLVTVSFSSVCTSPVLVVLDLISVHSVPEHTLSPTPRSTREATERVVKILDSKYEKANLNEIVANAKNLEKDQKKMLLKLLKQYKTLFFLSENG